MNKNVLKIFEMLGYHVKIKGNSLIVYDDEWKYINKKFVNSERYKGFDYILNGNQKIHFQGDSLEIKVNDKLSIVALNLYNELNCENIKLIISEDEPNHNYEVDFGIYKNNDPNINGNIRVDMYSDYDLSEDTEKKASLNITDAEGLALAYFQGHLDSVSVFDCTRETYINLITDFLGKVFPYLSDQTVKNIQEGFRIIKPSLDLMIDDLIERREAYNILFRKGGLR